MYLLSLIGWCIHLNNIYAKEANQGLNLNFFFHFVLTVLLLEGVKHIFSTNSTKVCCSFVLKLKTNF